METRECKVCTAPLGNKQPKFCSAACRNLNYKRELAANRLDHAILHCKNCNTELTGRQKEWCSLSCKREFGSEVVLLNDIATLVRTCVTCGLPKPLAADFYMTSTGTRRRECRACHMAGNVERLAVPDTADKRRNQHLMGLYGISSAQYEELLQAQQGVCAVCGKPPLRKRLSVDHDHVTGEIRGLLCNYCNLRVIGKARDAGLYRRAAHYLEDPPARRTLKDHRVPKGRKATPRRRKAKRRVRSA